MLITSFHAMLLISLCAICKQELFLLQDWSCKCREDCDPIPSCWSEARADWSDHSIWRPESLPCPVHAVQWISTCQPVPGKRTLWTYCNLLYFKAIYTCCWFSLFHLCRKFICDNRKLKWPVLMHSKDERRTTLFCLVSDPMNTRYTDLHCTYSIPYL